MFVSSSLSPISLLIKSTFSRYSWALTYSPRRTSTQVSVMLPLFCLQFLGVSKLLFQGILYPQQVDTDEKMPFLDFTASGFSFSVTNFKFWEVLSQNQIFFHSLGMFFQWFRSKILVSHNMWLHLVCHNFLCYFQELSQNILQLWQVHQSIEKHFRYKRSLSLVLLCHQSLFLS